MFLALFLLYWKFTEFDSNPVPFLKPSTYASMVIMDGDFPHRYTMIRLSLFVFVSPEKHWRRRAFHFLL